MKKVALGVLALALAVAQAPSAIATSITGHAIIDGVDTYSMTGITFDNPALVFVATLALSPLHFQLINMTSFNFSSAVGTTLFDFKSGALEVDLSILTLTVVHN